MNILQLEDDIKSLPDKNLMNAMQTGDYPQYLVLSELKRRKEMRDDYKGRMAAQEPDNTVADRIVNEASMDMSNQGIGNIVSPEVRNMQGMPQNTPQMPIDNQGIGQMMPSSMQGMKDGRTVYPNAGLAALAEKAPDVVKSMGYSQGGIVQMAPGQTVPFSDPRLTGYLNMFEERLKSSPEEDAYREQINQYFNPLEQEKRRKQQQAYQLMKAGLAVSSSATPEQLNKNLAPVIDSAMKSSGDRSKESLLQGKLQSGFAKEDRERIKTATELASKAMYTDTLRMQGDKPTSEQFWVNSVVNSDPSKFGIPIIEDGKTTGYEPNAAALERAAILKNFGQVNSAEQRLISETYDKAEKSWEDFSRKLRVNIENDNKNNKLGKTDSEILAEVEAAKSQYMLNQIQKVKDTLTRYGKKEGGQIPMQNIMYPNFESYSD
mgnify:FL=1